jgi:hypothetical protein
VTALSVAEALDQIGLRADHAVLSASRSRQIGTDGLALDVRLPRPVTVVADGVPTPTLTTASTVSDLLAERGLTLGSLDRVSAPLDSALTTGQEVRVTRVRVEHAYEPVPLPEGTVERADPGLPAGTRRAGEPGAPGALERTLLVTYTDGVETARAVVGEVVVTAPRPAVILVGTRPPPPPAPPARAAAPRPAAAPVPPASAGGLDWAALARCESGGNPRAASPNGLYFGLYQFSLPTWNSVGGTGNPVDASPEEQTARAQLLYSRSGAAPWPTCGRYL